MKRYLAVALISAITLMFAVNATAQPVPPKLPAKPPAAKVTPSSPKAGKLVVISTEAEAARFDFKGVFDPDTVRQVGKELTIALPAGKEAKTYTVRLMYWWEKEIHVDDIEIKVTGEAEPEVKPKPKPKPPPVPDDTAKQLKALTDAITNLTGVVTGLDKRVLFLEKQDPRPPPVPIPTTKVASITFVVFAPTKETAAVTEDTVFRVWLKDNGLKVYGITNQAQLDANSSFKKAVIASPPCIVLQDAEFNVIQSTAISSVESAKSFITPYLGK